MIKAKYSGDCFNDLIIGKVYDVIKTNGNAILILNELDEEDWYSTLRIPTLEPQFEDVTSDSRNDIIDGILK